MESDIVDRLRAPMNVLAFDDVTDEAAEEIERLRAELNRLGPLMLRAHAEIKQLRIERDEARLEICERVCKTRWHPQFPLMSSPQYAQERGWDCFGKDTNGRP